MLAAARYFVGLDLGQADDFTALAVLERPAEKTPEDRRRPVYQVRHLQRFPLGTSYLEIAADVIKLLDSPVLKGATLIVDGTGVGRAVVDLLRGEKGLQGIMRPIMITAGHAVSMGEDGYLHLAKIELVGILQALLQTRRLKIAKGLPAAEVLVREMQSFRVKVTAAANETFSARDGDHDDLVLAVAMACWWTEMLGSGGVMSCVEVPPRRERGQPRPTIEQRARGRATGHGVGR